MVAAANVACCGVVCVIACGGDVSAGRCLLAVCADTGVERLVGVRSRASVVTYAGRCRESRYGSERHRNLWGVQDKRGHNLQIAASGATSPQRTAALTQANECCSQEQGLQGVLGRSSPMLKRDLHADQGGRLPLSLTRALAHNGRQACVEVRVRAHGSYLFGRPFGGRWAFRACAVSCLVLRTIAPTCIIPGAQG